MFGSSRIIGLDVGDASVEAVFVDVSGKKPLWLARARAELPPGIVERGLVRDAKALGEAIRNALDAAQPHAITDREAVVNVPDQQSVSRLFLPEKPVPREKMAAVVGEDAAGFVPYPIEDVRVDWALAGPAGKGPEIFYAAAPQTTLKNLEAAAAAAGLTVGAFDLESLALVRLFASKDDAAAHLVLDVGAQTTVVSIAAGGLLRRTAVVDFGANDLTRALAEKEHIPTEKAELLKRKAGFQPEVAGGRIFFVLQKEIQPLIEEIRRSIEEFERTARIPVSRLTVAGGGALTPALPEYIGGALSLPAQIGDPVTAGIVAVPEPIPREDAVLYANALGLALSAVESAFPHLSFQRKDRMIRPQPAPLGGRPEDERAPGIAPAQLKKPVLSKRARLLVIIAGVVVALSAIGGVVAWRTLRPKSAPVVELPASLSFSFSTRLRFEGAGEGEGVPAKLLTHTATLRRPVPVQGSTETPTLASGTVTLVNAGATEQALVARTRLLSREGVLFRLRDAVTVPAGGSVGAAVVADQPGAQGNIPANSFTLPGLPTERQSEVTAESVQPMTGGVRVSGAITDAEIQRALSAVREDATGGAITAWKEALTPGEVLSSTPLNVSIVRSQLPEAGEVTEQAVPTIEVEARVLGASTTEAALAPLADAAAEKEAGVAELGGAYTYRGWQIVVEGYDDVAKTATVTVRVEAERT